MHHWRKCLRSALLLPALIGLAGCLSACRPAAPTPPEPAAPLVLYDWEEEIPPTVLAAFTAEYGIPVEYAGYTTMEEAVAGLQSGRAYDVAKLREDPMLYPSTETLRRAEILLPLSAEAERRYQVIGKAFLRDAP